MADLRRDRIPEAQYCPFDAGWDARLEGKRSSDNPWAVNNWKHYDWDKGWDKADPGDDAAMPPQQH